MEVFLSSRKVMIFGDGPQLRGFVYVDDAARAYPLAGASDACDGAVFDVGCEPISHPYVPGPAERQ